jgi:hypothetical protein
MISGQAVGRISGQAVGRIWDLIAGMISGRAAGIIWGRSGGIDSDLVHCRHLFPAGQATTLGGRLGAVFVHHYS